MLFLRRAVGGRPRGQATVELALGLLVFVTVLLFGIHFAEIGWLSLKVQEAGAWAVWESTGPRVQNLQAPRNVIPFNDTMGAGGLQQTATTQYRDFDGLSSASGSPIITAAMASGKSLTTTCTREPGLSFKPTDTAKAIYFDEGGLSCQTEALLDAIRIPSSFLDGSPEGFFKEKHLKPKPYAICAVGGRSAGGCSGKLSILTNDWGLAGDKPADNQSGSCNLGGGCTNPTYRDAVRAMWQGGGTFGRAFAENHAGSAPTDAMEFAFSYAGMEFNYFTPLPDEGGHAGYNTGGAGLGVVPANTAHNCFLGKAGCQ